MSKEYKKYSDFELVNLLRTEKPKANLAFAELYNRHSSMLHAYCYKIIGDEDAAEDIFQESFIKFYQNVSNELPNSNIPGFLVKIARNLCLNYKRDKRPTVPIEDLDFIFQDSQNYEQKELLDLITRSLDLVEDDYKEAFILREYSGLSYDEIAEACNISLSNAKSRVFRAKQKLKSILQPYLKDLKA